MHAERVERALFADVDGVLITKRSWLRPAGARQRPRFDPVGAQILRAICERCQATLVWNTTHSGWPQGGRNTLEAMARSEQLQRYTRSGADGLREGDTTGYPREHSDRLGAIKAWLTRYARAEALWCALDDAAIAHPNAVRVDPALGIGVREYWAATQRLGAPHEPLILL